MMRVISQLIVHPQLTPLRGSVPIPQDEQVLLPRLALAVLSRGKSRFQGGAQARATRVFLDSLSNFGVQVERDADEIVLHGTGFSGLSRADRILDLRGEAQSAALLCGLLAGRAFESALLVDQVLGETLLPLLVELGLAESELVEGGFRVVLLAREERSSGLELSTTGLFPWVKQAILLLGLRANSPTVVEEQIASPDHLERALFRARIPIEIVGAQVTVHPPRDEDALAPMSWEAVGSMELLAYLGALAVLIPGSEIGVRGAGTNPTRSSFFSLSRLLGAQVGFSPKGDRQGEPWGDYVFSGGKLRPAELSGEAMIRLGDGALPLSVLLGRTPGDSFLADLVSSGRAADPRIFQKLLGYLRSAGIEGVAEEFGIRLRGRTLARSPALRVTTGGDPRLALVGTLLGLVAEDVSVIDDVECLREMFPRWIGTLRALGARLEVREM